MGISGKKAYLFDFDGTLVDSMPTYVSVMLRILDENGVKYESDIIKTITPLGYKGTAEYYQALGVRLPVDEMVDTMKAYAEEAYTYHVMDKAGVKDTLEVLKRDFSLNVLTASPHKLLDPCLKRLGMWELFDNIWSCDDFNTSKANPEIYKMAAQRIGVSVDEMIFVDDNIDAVKTSKRAGVTTVGIYDRSSHELIDQMKKEADGYVLTFDALLDIK